jgi:two-component system, chemotaxis family, protein-glutamate methylesterase/glutaminase
MAHRDILVVGASAGGVAALQALVAGLPATLLPALLVVINRACM